MFEPLRHIDPTPSGRISFSPKKDGTVSEEEIDIRIATPADRDLVSLTYLKLLKELYHHDYDVLPTLKNADLLTDHIFMPAASRGEPILFGFDGFKLVGMIFWVVQNLPYEVRWKTAFDYGIYVEPDYRRQKLGTRIWTTGIEVLRSHGVKRLLSGVSLSNQVALKGSARLGFVPFQQLTYYDVESGG